MSEQDVVIQRMTEDDVLEVAELEKSIFPMPWSARSFTQELTENKCARYLVLKKQGHVIGYAGAWMIFEEAHITNIAIKKEEQGKKYGRLLTEALIQYAANLGVQYITLEVRVSNERAIQLYRSLGFKKVHVRQKYYEDNGEDGYLMVKDRMPTAEQDFCEQETVFE